MFLPISTALLNTGPTTTDNDTNTYPPRAIVSAAGVIKNLYIKFDGNVNSGKTVTVSLFLNGVATALSVQLTAGQSAGSNTVNQIAVVPGDLITLGSQGSPSSPYGASRLNYGMCFVPTVAGEAIYFSNCDGNAVSGAGNIWGRSRWGQGVFQMTGKGTVKNLYVLLKAAASQKIAVRRNSAETSLKVLTGGGVSGNDTTHMVAFDDGDLIDVNAMASGGTQGRIGLTMVAGIGLFIAAASAIGEEQATGNATLFNDAGGSIDEIGFDWGTVTGVYTEEVTQTGAFMAGAFALDMTGLSPSTWYFYRAKMHHSVFGWIYSDELYFQTAADAELVKFEYQTGSSTAWDYMSNRYWRSQGFTPAFTHILKAVKLKMYRAATGVMSDTVTVSVRATSGGLPTGSDLVVMTMPLNALTTNTAGVDYICGLGDGLLVTAGVVYCILVRTTYTSASIYVRAGGAVYAGGTKAWSQDYGATYTALTGDKYFEEWGDTGLRTLPPNNIRSNAATGEGYINAAADITQYGFEWGTVLGGPYPNETVETPPVVEEGIYEMELTGLSALTPYYYRAKAYSPTLGWFYANEIAFTTVAPVPQVRTDPFTAIGSDTLDAVGYIENIGSGNATRRGFVYGLTAVTTNPGNVAPAASGYDGDKYEDGDFGVGSFTLQLRNLEGGKTYYVRAYAQNGSGYGYGSQLKVMVSNTVCVMLPNSDVSVGIRFDTSPGGGYPHIYGGTIPHYILVRAKDTAFEIGYGFWGRFTSISGCYEHHYYNSNMYTDIYGLENPIRQTEGVIKVKWKARLFKNEYPYGDYQRHLVTHGVQYDGVKSFIITTEPGYDVCEIFYTNPNTGLAWTVAELNALQAGISIGDEASFGTAVVDALEVVALWANAAVETRPCMNFTGVTATLKGYVTEDEGEACTVRFNYGLTTAYGTNTAWQTKSKNSEFSADIVALDPDQQYHFRAEILTACGETFYSADAMVEGEFGTLILEQAHSGACLDGDNRAPHAPPHQAGKAARV
jgi:hypothetical protein